MLQRIKKVKTHMQIKLNVDKVKGHFRRHKELYIGIGIGVAVAVIAMFFFRQRAISNSVKIQGFINIKPTINSTILNFVETSTPSKPVHLVGSNLYAGSVNEMARLRGHSRTMVSRCANGHISDVKGDVFEFCTPSS